MKKTILSQKKLKDLIMKLEEKNFQKIINNYRIILLKLNND